MNAAKSTLFGLLLVLVAAGVLFWNEGRAVNTAIALAEGAGLVIEVDAAKPDPANDGKLVHVAGKLTPQDTPSDKAFGIAAPGALRLIRRAEMYQWQEVEREEKRKLADGKEETVKTIAYEMAWSDEPVDSAKFKSANAPKNPPMPILGERFPVSGASIGGFSLAGDDVAGLGAELPLLLTSEDWSAFKQAFGGSKPVWFRDNGLHAGLIFGKPAIGDLRITYQKGSADQASVAGKQSGARLGPYTTSNGRNVFLIQDGIATPAQMFDDAQAGNTALTWIARVLGLAAMFLGFKLAFSILTAIGDAIPFVGNLVRGGTSLVAFALAMLVGLLAIGLGWIFYRPILGLAIIAAGLAIAFALSFMGRGKTPSAPS
jgi:Transmembrane protein 43